MQLQINEESLPVYEALASKTRIKIIQLLSKKDECQRFGKRTWSEQCYHDDAREKARGSKHHQNRKSRTTKISSLRVDKIDISFPEKYSMLLIRKKHRYLLVTIQIMQLNQHAV